MWSRDEKNRLNVWRVGDQPDPPMEGTPEAEAPRDALRSLMPRLSRSGQVPRPSFQILGAFRLEPLDRRLVPPGLG